MPSKVVFCLIVILLIPSFGMGFNYEEPLGSLECYTGLLQMPNARIIPDWHIRFNYGHSSPYSYYGGAIGFFDRIEFHGQFTEISTIDAFKGYGYGHYKDRSAGARLVLLREKDFFPQVAIGAFDATGTALFAQRYIVFSKMIKNLDVTFGLGQGVLAGEFFVKPNGNSEWGRDTALSFLLSSPFRKTKPFGGVEYHATPNLTFTAEYSSIDYDNMFGYRDIKKTGVKRDNSKIPLNFGIKYRIGSSIYAKLAYMRGSWGALGINVDLPLNPEGFLGWKKEPNYRPYEKLRYKSYFATNEDLAKILASELEKDGFIEVRVAVGDSSVWIEAANSKYISNLRAIRRVFEVIDILCPPRIKNLYINLKEHTQILVSIKTTRENIQAFLQSKVDKKNFLNYSDVDLYKGKNLNEFLKDKNVSSFVSPKEKWWSIKIEPKIYTFLNNRAGFFKHKGILRTSLNLYPTDTTLIKSELEVTLFNQYDELIYPPLEPEPTRTDMVLYEKNSKPRLTQLAMDQIVELPYSFLVRGAVGYFEYGYAGIGIEGFRFFRQGKMGFGFESEVVKKRDIDNNFSIKKDSPTFYTAFLNTYFQLWPSQGLEGGFKIGRFLAGDKGIKFILRRSFKYFTVGAWYTKTDTSVFKSKKNRNAEEKGVYISIPFAVFSNKEKRGWLTYGITSFTRDQGQTVEQPRYLYPLNPWHTPDYIKRHLDELKTQ
ncbi:YjbH domain-containing protein [Desulfothermus okinawensis JCM 13304]